MFREVEDVVETLKNAKARGKKCSVLIGAGCSVTAGIPTAQGFVDIIKERYPRSYERAEEKTYPKCMSQLAIDEQRSLLVEFVDKAKINWAHIALAQLMKEGYVDRVLTTNFDPLIMRACSLVNLYPATYDLASSQHFERDKVPDQAIFHLHGQRTGFVLLNSDKVLKEHAAKLQPIFEDAGTGRVWLVVGYSGENDPVFTRLAEVKHFDNNLYWVGYKENEPAQHLKDHLLLDEKYAFYIKGYDSDSFFTKLAQQLACFPPDFVGKPFSYLDGLFDSLTEYTIPQSSTPINYVNHARQFIRSAIADIEAVQSDVMQAWSDLLSGNFGSIYKLEEKYTSGMHPEVKDILANAYFLDSIIISPQIFEGKEDDTNLRYEEQNEKFKKSLSFKPENDNLFIFWGNTLLKLAKLKSGVEADVLFTQSVEKFEAALNIKSDRYETLDSWGNALSEWAKTKVGKEADDLFVQAEEKYEASLKLKPNNHDALNNWGIILSYRAKNKSGTEADNLYKRAESKYEAALNIKPDKYEVLYNWGTALSNWVEMKNAIEADDLYVQIVEKYEATLKIKPDNLDALNNWGSILLKWGNAKGGKKKIELYEQAKEILSQAEIIKEGSASYNLACIFGLLDEEDECKHWLKKSKDLGNLPSKRHLEQDKDLDLMRDKDWFIKFMQEVK